MRIPLSWLDEFVHTALSAEDLAELVVPRGVKVEGIDRPWAGLGGVVVARVIEVRDHPSSDKLCVARIAHGSGETELVVGVRNMAPGDLVPWAPPGSRVPTLPDPLEARSLRGVVSDGMLCSALELGVSPDHGGILVLNDEHPEIGAQVKDLLGLDDAVLDIEVEPNRPDLLSVLGVAREVAAATSLPMAHPGGPIVETEPDAGSAASVAIEAFDACPRYVARIIRGVEVRTSPLRAQARLTACGIRPISSVVDATNYAMLELGQPLHGFDMAALAGPGVVVRRAAEGDALTTLDDVDRRLDPDDLLICDLERPVAIAGVMGGAATEVSADTSQVLLESAHFTRGGVLRTARRLDLHTEASHRFERGVDPEGLERGAERGAELIVAWSGGATLRGVVAAGATPARHRVTVRPQRASALLGYPVTPPDVHAVFEQLDMEHRDQDGAVEVEVPGYRFDIDREVDLIEEVARVQGYARIGSSLPRAPHAGGMPGEYAFVRTVKRILAGSGLREIRPAPFVAAEDLALIGDRDAIVVANPLRSEEGFLRTGLLSGLLHTIARNQATGARSIALFEIGAVFRSGEPVEERRKVAWVMAGAAATGWYGDRRPYDVLDVRGVLEALLHQVGVDDWSLDGVPDGPFHPGRSATVLVGGEPAGVLGEIHPRRAEELDLEGRIAVAELELAPLRFGSAKGAGFEELPRFPPVRRDLAFVLPEGAAAGDVTVALEQAAGGVLDRCTLFDVFRGPPLAEGTKSLAFTIDLRASDRTLTDPEADDVVRRIVDRLASDFGAHLRA